jgi:hypothetical protein
MSATIYEVACTIPSACVDGRSMVGLWGHEHHFHGDRLSADLACARLRAGGYWGCTEPPSYEVLSRSRTDYPSDFLGEAEWRAACREAGVDPVSGEVLVHA